MSGELIWVVVRLLVALPLVLGMAYLVLKYGLARRYVVTTGKRRMKLVEQLPLGPKATLSLIALGDRYYLFVHQDNSVSLVKELSELPDPEDIKEDAKIGDIVELTPRTIEEEFDRLQKSGASDKAGSLAEMLKEKYPPQLNKLAGWAAQAKDSLSARRFARTRTGKKGGKKIEG